MFEYELRLEHYWGRLIVVKTRPVYEWERHLKWSAPECGDRRAMAVSVFEGTLGM